VESDLLFKELRVFFAKEPYKRDDILQKRMFLSTETYPDIGYRSLLQKSTIKETIFCRRGCCHQDIGVPYLGFS